MNRKTKVIITTIFVILVALVGVFFVFEIVNSSNKGTTGSGKGSFVEIDKNSIIGDGGWKKQDVLNAYEDPNCSIAEDFEFSIKCVEYNDIVIFYYTTIDNGFEITPNIVFKKTDKGLTFAGCFNVHCKFQTNAFLWFGNSTYEFDTEFNYGENFLNLNNHKCSVNVLKGMFNRPRYFIDCYSYDLYSLIGKVDIWGSITSGIQFNKNRLYINDIMFEGCLDVMSNYFYSFSHTENDIVKTLSILHGEENYVSTAEQNNFYTSLYNAVKEHNVSSTIDVSSMMFYTERKVGEEISTITKSNLTLKVDLISNDWNALKGQNEEKVKIHESAIVESIDLPVTPNCQIRVIPDVNVSFVDFENNPIIFTLKNTETSKTYQFKFDNYSELNGLTKSLPFGEYSFNIDTALFTFGESASGTLTFNENTNKINNTYTFDFPCVYTKGIVKANFYLEELSMCNLNYADLKNEPVYLKLIGKEEKTLVYNTKDLVLNGISVDIPVGEYEYEIESNNLQFVITKGFININYNQYEFKFGYEFSYARMGKLIVGGYSNNDINYIQHFEFDFTVQSAISLDKIKSFKLIHHKANDIANEYELECVDGKANYYINNENDVVSENDKIQIIIETTDNGSVISDVRNYLWTDYKYFKITIAVGGII